VELISQTLLDELAAKAAASPRRRAHHNIHAAAADPVQRFIVVAHSDSYFRPHRHPLRWELAVIVRGHVDVVTFDARGRVLARYPCGEDSGTLAYQNPQGSWHTVVPGSDGGAFLEIKQGPYDPTTAAEFAAWAPAEGDPTAPVFLDWLRHARPGDTPPA
jgi:cupin fold WbuC family metalloprotein